VDIQTGKTAASLIECWIAFMHYHPRANDWHQQKLWLGYVKRCLKDVNRVKRNHIQECMEQIT